MTLGFSLSVVGLGLQVLLSPSPLQQVLAFGGRDSLQRHRTFFGQRQRFVVTTTTPVQGIVASKSSSSLSYAKEDNASNDEIISPVLQQVFPSLIKHKEEYGHPDIPLGTPEGRQCATLRRLKVQGKLDESDVKLLTDLGFRWTSLEELYGMVDFDELYERLVKYKTDNDGDVSPPKKYQYDPELGAWVAGIRRLGPNVIDADHAKRLNDIDFVWVPTRRCGSAFMKQYRAIQERLDEGDDTVGSDEKVLTWIGAQQEAAKRGTLGETRQHYLHQLILALDN